MLRGAGLVPSTFEDTINNITEDDVSTMLDTLSEVIRMVKEGDPNSDDNGARNFYGKYLATEPPADSA